MRLEKNVSDVQQFVHLREVLPLLNLAAGGPSAAGQQEAGGGWEARGGLSSALLKAEAGGGSR